ncbi:MAG: tetratricopeptide repeat protein [Planctomycetes bacterium]|nr:tetratricopeptide repeat protein [Planctomycetota bacterium]
MTRSRKSGAVSRGTLVVAVMLLLAVAAGLIARNYWSGVVARTFPATQPGAGSVKWDPRKARDELEALQKHLASAADTGNTAGIREDARQLVERYPRFAPAHTLLAQVLMLEGRLPEAYEQLKTSIDLDKQQPEVHLFAGTTARQLGKTDEAARYYANAVQLAPQEPNYKLFLADVYIKRNDLDRAQMMILDALAIDSSSYSAYALMSELCAKRNQLDQALTNIQRAIENTPVARRPLQVQYICRKAGLLRRANKPDGALQVLGTLSAAERADESVLGETAVCWAMLGKPAKAAEVYESAFRNDPTNAKLAVAAARWRVKAGDKAGAKAMIDRVRSLSPRLPVLVELEGDLAKMK